MDEGYDSATTHAAFEERDCHPVIHMRRRTVKRGEHLPPRCEHGEWRFGGAENDRKAAKWFCPTAECCPPMIRRKASRLHPLIPYGSARWKKHFATRGAVERVYGRLKEWYGLTPVRVRGLERVSLHADLCVFARLTEALVLARAAP